MSRKSAEYKKTTTRDPMHAQARTAGLSSIIEGHESRSGVYVEIQAQDNFMKWTGNLEK